FMYGGAPMFQGPIATAMGGVDLSWLAGTATSAGLYFALGYPRFKNRIHHGVPLGIMGGVSDQDYLESHGDASAHDGEYAPSSVASPPAGVHAAAADSATVS
ncbi:MAG: hypothetical protein ACKOVB_05385, partial [Terrabacter sp.]